jgi:hypothetical protein
MVRDAEPCQHKGRLIPQMGEKPFPLVAPFKEFKITIPVGV